MKLVLPIDNAGNAIEFEGEITQYDVTSCNKGLSELNISLRLSEYFRITKNDDYTRIIKLPRLSDGVVRIGGPNEVRIQADTSLVIHFRFPHVRFHASYEEACSAAMEEIITKGERRP